MTSPTDITKKRRAAKAVKAGQKRKNKVRREGTTPQIFKLDKPAPVAAQ